MVVDSAVESDGPLAVWKVTIFLGGNSSQYHCLGGNVLAS